jgi:hypothetical protein
VLVLVQVLVQVQVLAPVLVSYWALRITQAAVLACAIRTPRYQRIASPARNCA